MFIKQPNTEETAFQLLVEAARKDAPDCLKPEITDELIQNALAETLASLILNSKAVAHLFIQNVSDMATERHLTKVRESN